jgi:hypothetical protein
MLKKYVIMSGRVLSLTANAKTGAAIVALVDRYPPFQWRFFLNV